MKEEGDVRLAFTLLCLLAEGSKAHFSDTVRLNVRILSFSLDHNFMILNGGQLTTILGIDFLGRTKIGVVLYSRSYRYAIAANLKGLFSAADLHETCEANLQNLCGLAVHFTALEQSHPSGLT